VRSTRMRLDRRIDREPTRRAFLPLPRTGSPREGKKPEPVSVLMFDLDHFKRSMTAFGSQVGDEVCGRSPRTRAPAANGPKWSPRNGSARNFVAICGLAVV